MPTIEQKKEALEAINNVGMMVSILIPQDKKNDAVSFVETARSVLEQSITQPSYATIDEAIDKMLGNADTETGHYMVDKGNIQALFATVKTDGWLDISLAPKDGTEILIDHDDWDCAYKAKWGEYAGNPVEDDDGEMSNVFGWVLRDDFIHCPHACENGFIGWAEDTKPTRFMYLPPKHKIGDEP